jgi:hypothetical protein
MWGRGVPNNWHYYYFRDTDSRRVAVEEDHAGGRIDGEVHDALEVERDARVVQHVVQAAARGELRVVPKSRKNKTA